MMNKIKPVFLVFLAIILVHANAPSVFAGPEDYRQCSKTETCEIGEFLYDDDYSPIATASCVLNSKDPDGNVFLNDVAMTAESDGWYSYVVDTSSEDYGLYRSQICCTYLTEYICLDKSFQIASDSASLSEDAIADAVWDEQTSGHTTAGSFGENAQNSSSITVDEIWSAPQRSLTSFGTLVGDVWGYSSRSVSSFSSLVSAIWSSDDRTITENTLDDGELATKTQVEAASGGASSSELADLSAELSAISQQLNANRYFLELLVNEPIIEVFIEEGQETPDLQAKIRATKQVAQNLSNDIDSLSQNIASLDTNWDDTSYQIALNEVSSATKVLGVTTDGGLEPNNINSKIVWLGQKWKSPIISNLSVQTTSALSNVNGINREIKSYGKTFISKQYLDIAGQNVDKLDQIVGDETDLGNIGTLYGYIAYIEDISDILIKRSHELDELLDNWNNYTDTEKDLKLLRIKEKIISVNQIEGAEILLKSKVNDEKHRENLALALRGLINANLNYLAQDADKISQNTWLEHGSIVFRSLVTNPSDTIAQNVKIKYYLPQEISQEHIIKIEDGLITEFDAEKNSLYVSGEVLLDPEETKTFIVEVIDVWIIPEEEIVSIRKQTETLFDSLKNTSYFAQGATIKADIEVNLDKVAILQEKTQTPELKIKSHREAMLEINSAKSKLENLKTIVSSAGSVGTLFGFVGGVQAIAVWGLVIILITGFVFLLIYLKTITKSQNSKSKEPDQSDSEKEKDIAPKPKKASKKANLIVEDDLSIFAMIKDIISMKFNLGSKTHKKGGGKNNKTPIVFVLLFMLASIAAIITYSVGADNSPTKPQVTQAEPDIPDFTTQHLDPKPIAQPKIDTEKADQIAVASDAATSKPGLILGKATSEDELKEDFSKINTDNLDLGDTENNDPSLEKGTIVRVKIPDGYQAINVRREPTEDSELSGRLYINQNVYILQKENGWVLIKTNNESLNIPVVGWILQKLISSASLNENL